jgi:hypothetical protein
MSPRSHAAAFEQPSLCGRRSLTHFSQKPKLQFPPPVQSEEFVQTWQLVVPSASLSQAQLQVIAGLNGVIGPISAFRSTCIAHGGTT